jgi:GntR family transcriptional regulator
MSRSLDGNGKTPLYVQLKQQLLEDIRGGRFVPGEPIPPETQLTEEYSVSRATVRQAIAELVNEGVLVRKQGKGTFVNKPKIETNLQHLYSFSQSIRDKGLQPASQIIEFEVVLPKPEVAAALNIEEGKLVYKIVLLRYADQEVIMVETTYLPYEMFDGLSQEWIEERQSLYAVLEREYKLKLNHAVESFEPVVTDDFASRLLGVPKHSPALFIERIGYTEDGRNAEYTQSVVRGDRCRYVVKLTPVTGPTE